MPPHKVVREIGNPILGNTPRSIESRLPAPVIRERRIGNLDYQQDVGRAGVTRCVEIGPRSQEHEIRLRLVEPVETHGALWLHDGVVASRQHQGPVRGAQTARVPRAYRRHRDHCTVDELDALLLTEYSGIDHAVVLVHREPLAKRHRRCHEPSRILASSKRTMCRVDYSTIAAHASWRDAVLASPFG